MSEFNFTITNCLMSKVEDNDIDSRWTMSDYHGNKHELYVARANNSGNYSYYVSVLEISTKQQFIEPQRMIIEMTHANRDNIFSAINSSAILCSKNNKLSTGLITPKEAYQLAGISSAEDFNKLGAPYIAYSARGEDFLDNKVQKRRWIIDLQGKNLEANKNYYIYLKRAIMYSNGDKGQGNGGFLPLKNPLFNGYENSYNIIVEATPFEDNEPKAENYFIKPDGIREYQIPTEGLGFKIWKKATADQEEELASDLNPTGGIIWEYEIENANGNIPAMNIDENGFFTYTPNQTFSGTVKVIASWSNGRNKLESNIIIPLKWVGFQNWLTGYAMKIMGTPIPINTPIYYQYGNHVVRDLPNQECFKDYYFYLTINILHNNSYSLFVSSQPLYYNIDADVFQIKNINGEIINTEVFVSDSIEGQKWGDFKNIDLESENFSINPIWTSKNVLDKNYIEPIAIYQYQ